MSADPSNGGAIATTTSNYIPAATDASAHFNQASSAATASGDEAGTSEIDPSRSRISLLQTHLESDSRYGNPQIAVISIASSSPPISSEPAPPAYVIATAHDAIPSQSGVSNLRMPPDQPISMQEDNAEAHLNLAPHPPVGLTSAYQLDLQQGILSLNPQHGHHHYPIVWLPSTVPHAIKNPIPNSVPLPPVSEVHPSRGAKLARISESNSPSTQQVPLGESNRQSTLHSYLTQVLPSMQDANVAKLPKIEPRPSRLDVAPLPSLRVSETHHSITAALLTDVSCTASSFDRTSNIYSIAPSQATATCGSHALTSDTSVHTQLPALMRTTDVEQQHHSHDGAINGAHFSNALVHMGLGLEAGLDKHQHHAHHHHHHHDHHHQQQHQDQQPNVMISSSIPLSTSDMTGTLLNSALVDQRAQIIDSFNVTFSSHSEITMPHTKHNPMPQDGSAPLMTAHHSGINLAVDLGASMQDDSSGHALRHPSSDANDLVETLACYRCKVCPFISFSKEGVEQHVRATHLKLDEACESKDPVADSAQKPCAHENPVHQQPASHGGVAGSDDAAQGKESMYICGMCERGFSDIESCGVHMAVEHNLPVDQVHLEPLPSMPVPSVPIMPPPPPSLTIVPLPQQSQPHPFPPPDPAARQNPVPGQEALAAKPKTAKKKKATAKTHQNCDSLGAALKMDDKEQDCIVIKCEKTEADAEREEAGTAAALRDGSGEAAADSAESNADSSANNAANKSTAKKRGRPRGSKTLGITALRKKNRTSKASDDHLLGYRCDTNGCAVRMQSMENLEYHRKCHVKDAEHFECPECKERYDNWKSTSVHLWRVHVVDMELYSCDLCSYKTYSYGKLMNMHRRIHSDERLFMCDSCGRCFKTNKQLRNHKVIHLDKRKNRSFRSGECDICNRHFADKRMLRVHKDTVHNKLRPYLCQYCSYTASCRSTLKMHIRQHTGEKPFGCEQCEYRTADHNSLRRHKMRHSGEKPYKCPFCPYKSIQSSTYKTHLKNKHPGLDEGLLFSCEHCPFRTIKKENYITHVADHKNGGIVIQQMPMQQDADATPIQIPLQVVLPGSTSITVQTSTASPPYFPPPHSQTSGAHLSDGSLQPQMEIIPFIFSVPEEMRQRISNPPIYSVESDNPEERFPILASQLKIGQVTGNHNEGETHGLTITQMDSMEDNRRIQIISSQLAQESAVEESDQHIAPSHESLSHAQLTPVPPESILPN